MDYLGLRKKFGVGWRKGLYELAFKTPLRELYFGPQFMFSPSQLFFICEKAREAALVGGRFFEVGAASGSTTIFVNNYLKDYDIKVDYTIIDTFSGFTDNDARFEIEQRGVSSRIRHSFSLNSRRWVAKRLEKNGLPHIRCVEIDASKYDYSGRPPIAFALIDVDIYKPIKNVLPRVYENLADGGIVIVDNCESDHPLWSGAYQAYREFTDELHLPAKIVYKKLGLLQK